MSSQQTRVVTFRAEDGHNYSASCGAVTVHGWVRGTKREAVREAKAHLSEELAKQAEVSHA